MGAEAMRKTKLAMMMALLPFAAQAQTPAPFVPEIQKGALVAAVDQSAGMSEPPITITPQDRQALNIAGKWIKHTSRPIPAEDGSVQYIFGASIPTVICTPMYSCAVRLQPGEQVTSIHAGDGPRWSIKGSSYGNGSAETTAIVVKPKEFNITTNMIVTTDRRIYTIVLKSAKHEWMPFISFSYPEDEEKANAQFQAQQQRAVYSSTLSNGMNVSNLDFGYKISGDNVSWKPIRVYSDGVKTYIEFDSLGNEAPIFAELQSKGGMFSDINTKVVNYRFIGKKLVVDGIPKLSALIVGVGKDQKMVTIERTGGAK